MDSNTEVVLSEDLVTEKLRSYLKVDKQQNNGVVVKFSDIFATYCVKTESFMVDSVSNVGQIHKVFRSYGNFVALQDKLFKIYFSFGLIFPPLPEPVIAEEKIRSSKHDDVLREYNFRVENAAEFGYYLRFLSVHPIFGATELFYRFLTAEKFQNLELSPSKKSSLFKFSLVKWINNYNDKDSFFEHEKEFVAGLTGGLEKMRANFESVLQCNRKICNVLGHLSTCITSNLVIQEQQASSIVFYKLFCNSLDNYKLFTEVRNISAYDKLEVFLQYITAYDLSYKSVLMQRIDLLNAFEAAKKRNARATEPKRPESMESVVKTNEKLDSFSTNAKMEINFYYKHRCNEMTKAIQQYAEAQMVIASKAVAALRETIESLSQIEF